MQLVNGIYLPDRDKHFANYLQHSPLEDGKATYQLDKIITGINECNAYYTALDIGANVGLWSRILSKHFERVISIEPIYENICCLQKNIEDCKNVEIIVCAISPYNGRLSMKHMDDVATSYVSAYEDKDLEVSCRPLDSFEFEDVSFIKVDVEGYENNVIKSGERTIRGQKPTIIVEQKKRSARYDGRRFAAVETLQEWGMTVAWEMSGDFCLVWR